jgi:coenzyme F420-0:L-glutamate ligase / coenzyme F420-1:gamma-L-glutamate ligase
MNSITIIPIEGVPEIEPGDDLARLIYERIDSDGLIDGDVVVIAHKVVSKAEGRIIDADERHRHIVEESIRVLRRAGDMVIAETRHGFVCANAGVDSSNIAGARALLLPLDPDLSARRVRAQFEHLSGAKVGVIVSDTFGRAWRLGQTNVAIGIAGIHAFVDYRGTKDADGKELWATRICIADEIAGAAEMVMGKANRIPAAIVRGVPTQLGRGAATDIVRPVDEDLFR